MILTPFDHDTQFTRFLTYLSRVNLSGLYPRLAAIAIRARRLALRTDQLKQNEESWQNYAEEAKLCRRE